MNSRWPLLALLIAAGCATTTTERPAATAATTTPESAAPTTDDVSVSPVAPANDGANGTSDGPWPEAVDALTLGEALTLAEGAHPRLAVAQHGIRMAEGDALQVGLWPNPVLGMAIEAYTPDAEGRLRDLSQVENAVELFNRGRNALQAGGANPLFPNAQPWVPAVAEPTRPDQRQDVIGVTQSIPLGGLPGKARTAARKEVARLQAVASDERLSLRADVKAAFEGVLYHQRVLEGLGELAGMLEQVVGVARQRFESGDVAEVEVVRSEANLGRFRVEVRMADQDLIAAESRLAEAMGLPLLRIGACVGNLEGTLPDIALEQLREALENHPRAQARERAQERAAAEVDVADAGKWPDLSLAVNYRRFTLTNQDTWDLGVDVELPFFDRNQGEIQRARGNLRRETVLATAERHAVLAQAQTLLATYRTNRDRVAAFEGDVLPRMQDTLAIVQEAYTSGDVGLLEVLDAHRALVEARLSYLRELYDLRRTVTELERLSGAPL